ncbi:MAG TPA: hypothetical protein VNO32_54150 [Candidatus Acidoferrum sp.]|nr:hypothetical protein [Candidatus Acidoferrum sp.]
MARELGCTTVNDLFDRAEAFGIVGREHLFKKSDGKIVVSDKPYRKGTSKGMGEYVGSRYWINWEKVKQLTEKGVAESATPTETEPPPDGGVAENATPSGVAESATPKESATCKKNGVADSATPVADSATKGLKYSTPLLPPEATETASVSPAKPSREPIKNPNLVVVGKKFKPSGQKNTDAEEHSESIVTEHRKRQLERKMTDAEIFREFNKVFDRLQHEYDAHKQAVGEAYRAAQAATGKRKLTQEQSDVLDAMPRGKNFENDELTSTKPQRHDAAELYRTKGHDTTMREWEEFLVKRDHTVITAEDEVDFESGKPTGRKIPKEVESTNLLYFFVLEYGVKLEEVAK